MAFIKITKSGKKSMHIPASSLPKYEASGWKSEMRKKGQPLNKLGKKDEWEEADEELSEEKSVDEMSMDELQNKAKALGLDIKNISTVGALKKAVKRALNN